MDYSFDELINRRGTNAYKWDSCPDEDTIPLWVADMDFKTFPGIIEVLKKRVEHGIFGYTKVPDAYYQSVINWFGSRHHWSFPKEWILYTSGVVPAISAVIKAMTQPGDQVIVQTPVYNCFFSSIRNNGCEIVSNPLIYEGQTYCIDFEDLEAKVSNPKAKILLLCNPHNPAGRVWTKDELMRIGEICVKQHIWVISDEIHCEFVYPGHTYIPFASLSDEIQHHTITCNAPSKAFNTAGLQIANIICDNEEVRQKIDKAININEVCDVNPFGPVALEAAYSPEGERWLSEMNTVVWQHYDELALVFRRELPDLPVCELEGTYLAWIDVSAVGLGSDEIERALLQEEQVWVNAGAMYGADGFIRINLACPTAQFREGLHRVVEGLKRLIVK